MKQTKSSKSVILAAFSANLFIALVKFVLAYFSASSAMLAVKAEFNEHLNARQICVLINGLEKDIRTQFPEVNKIFIEPDIFRKQ